ncbi:hypothetical protein SAY86_025950 [Trapa natans]|uniref:Wall-associated receptor kinase galacturonan-binding domain-containing protein n=1 Tax=Trapa natans TaxID=22666 RepID=A0AAN7KKW2_TRANT|nr:hypothetical protein SAY86_025950 [Trapa natans]
MIWTSHRPLHSHPSPSLHRYGNHATLDVFLRAAVALLLATSIAALTCPHCGSTSVPYPLSTSDTCGHPSYKILCNTTSGSLSFPTLNKIVSINPDTQRLVISPAPLVSRRCVTMDLRTLVVQLNSSLPFNVTSSNTIMLLNCSTALLQSPLNCTEASLCHAYVNGTPSVDRGCGDSPICCTFKTGGSTTAYWIRVREDECRAYTIFVNLDPTLSVGQWPQPGLEIEWTAPPSN